MASIAALFKGFRRGTTDEKSAELDAMNNLLAAQGAAPYMEITRLGFGYATMATAAVAALVVRPDTAAAFEIFNSHPIGGKSLVVDRLFSHWLVQSTTSLGSGCGIYAMVTTVKVAVSTGSFNIASLRGKRMGTGITGTSPVIAAAGTTVVDNGWFPYGTSVKHESAGAVVPGGILTADVLGRLIVPPQSSLCLHVVSGYAGDTFTSGASWYEVQLDLP